MTDDKQELEKQQEPPRWLNYLIIATFILVAFIVMTVWNIAILTSILDIGHPDSPYNTPKNEIEEYCDWDITKTKFGIKQRRDGKFALVKHYKTIGPRVVEGHHGEVIGRDTCYLKYRAYIFHEAIKAAQFVD